MSGQLCLKWNNHSIAFNKLLNNIFLEDVYSDGTIVCQGKFYPVHRFVLSTCSEYFEKMFHQCNQLKSKYPFIIVKDIQCDQMEALLNYMYKGEVNVPQEHLPELIKAAEVFKIKGLAVPDEEPPVHKSSRKRSNISSPQSHSKKTKRFEVEDVPSVNIPQELLSDRLYPKNTVEENKRSSHLISTANAKIDELLPIEPILIKSEPLDSQDLTINIDDSRENKSPLKEEQQDMENFTGNNSNFQPFEFDPSDENFDMEQSTSWDNSQVFEGQEGSENDPQSAHGVRFQKRVLDEPIQCSFPSCNYKSIYLKDLERHYRIHTGEKPFQCQYCSHKSTRKNNLKLHISRKHRQYSIERHNENYTKDYV